MPHSVITEKSGDTGPVSIGAFIEDIVDPVVDRLDREERTPPEVLAKFAESGFLGVCIGASHGGLGYDSARLAILFEALGGASASALSLFTVHGIATHVIDRWGNAAQKDRLLPAMAKGERIGAFALTEPDVGSDAANVACAARPTADGFVVDGTKNWISFGQCADLFVVIANAPQGSIALLVEAASPGITIEPIRNMLGFRGAMLANIGFKDVFVPAENVLGRPGFGFSHVVGSALDFGRFAIAWGCVGIAQACIDASLDYALRRQQFGMPLIKHQLVQGLIADMVTETKAARALCEAATSLRQNKDPDAIVEVATAKYFAARTAMRGATSAVQIFGARGCTADNPVERYFRDAKITEIIEGSNQMHQIIIAQQAATRRERTGK